MANFSVHFIIQNDSSHTLYYNDRSADDGNWHDPIKTGYQIKPGDRFRTDLNDVGGTSRGAEGSITFFVIGDDGPDFIKFYGSCPVTGDNVLKATVDDPQVVKVEVGSYAKSGHPLPGNFYVQEL